MMSMREGELMDNIGGYVNPLRLLQIYTSWCGHTGLARPIGAHHCRLPHPDLAAGGLQQHPAH